jgi:hypothetical protein
MGWGAVRVPGAATVGQRQQCLLCVAYRDGGRAHRAAARGYRTPRTSSTPGFVQAVDPDIVLFAVGYRNRFGLPRPAVLQRYLRGGATVLDTAQSGAIQLRLVAGRGVQVVPFRDRVRRYWQ